MPMFGASVAHLRRKLQEYIHLDLGLGVEVGVGELFTLWIKRVSGGARV